MGHMCERILKHDACHTDEEFEYLSIALIAMICIGKSKNLEAVVAYFAGSKSGNSFIALEDCCDRYREKSKQLEVVVVEFYQ